LNKCSTPFFAIVVPNSVCDLHVGCIPGLVTGQQLRTLFPHAISIDYRQGKITRKRVKLGYRMKRSVIHLFLIVGFINCRFAVLHFVDIQLAAQVMQNADQYFIDNQLLSITYGVLQNTIANTTDNSGCL